MRQFTRVNCTRFSKKVGDRPSLQKASDDIEFTDPGMMGHPIAYGATTKINRKDFGLSLSMVLDGRLVVGEEIQIMIEGEIVEQKEDAAAGTS